MARFIRFPWATTGDRATVPFDTDPGGSVTYAQGFGPDYEIAPGDPGWKPVPRDETNGFYYDLTENIRQYQLNGAPEWHPAADNAGVAIAYPINATVRHNDLVYRSLTATNTAEPGTDPAKWVVVGIAGPATTAVAGLMRFATTAEAAARIVTDAAVTPAGLGALFNLLLNQPIFPEVAGGGLFTVTIPVTGTVRVGAGTPWTHRGAFSYTSVQTDLATVANKTYHLRWDRVNGFALYDLAAGSYNPSAVPETDVSFDTTYDSMLVARVVTSAANVATITTLINKDRLALTAVLSGTNIRNPGVNGALFDFAQGINWARTPTQRTFSPLQIKTSLSLPEQGDFLIGQQPNAAIPGFAITRYALSQTVLCDNTTNLQMQVSVAA